MEADRHQLLVDCDLQDGHQRAVYAVFLLNTTAVVIIMLGL